MGHSCGPRAFALSILLSLFIPLSCLHGQPGPRRSGTPTVGSLISELRNPGLSPPAVPFVHISHYVDFASYSGADASVKVRFFPDALSQKLDALIAEGAQVATEIRPYIKDSDSKVRLAAVMVLAALGAASELPALQETIRTEPLLPAKYFMLISLLSSYKDEAVPFGLSILRDPAEPFFVRFYLARLIAHFGGSPGLRGLISELSVSDARRYSVAIFALSSYGPTNDFFISR